MLKVNKQAPFYDTYVFDFEDGARTCFRIDAFLESAWDLKQLMYMMMCEHKDNEDEAMQIFMSVLWLFLSKAPNTLHAVDEKWVPVMDALRVRLRELFPETNECWELKPSSSTAFSKISWTTASVVIAKVLY